MATLASRINDLASAIAAALKSQRGVSAFCSGKPGGGEIIGGAVAPYAFTINPAKCVAIASGAATANAVFTLRLDGVAIGTITFSAAATAGVYAMSATAIDAGKLLTLTAPATADGTLANITFLIRP